MIDIQDDAVNKVITHQHELVSVSFNWNPIEATWNIFTKYL